MLPNSSCAAQQTSLCLGSCQQMAIYFKHSIIHLEGQEHDERQHADYAEDLRSDAALQRITSYVVGRAKATCHR